MFQALKKCLHCMHANLPLDSFHATGDKQHLLSTKQQTIVNTGNPQINPLRTYHFMQDADGETKDVFRYVALDSRPN